MQLLRCGLTPDHLKRGVYEKEVKIFCSRGISFDHGGMNDQGEERSFSLATRLFSNTQIYACGGDSDLLPSDIKVE
ncbi:hypothetical protein Bca4012_028136 [Brassica carinata]